MRYSYAETMTDPSYYAPLAIAAEEAGYANFVVPDSICYPQTSDSVYPYNPDGTREFLEDKPFIDPFALTAALGAVTSTIRFTTFVIKLPIRHPVLTAKQAGSVAALTGGRLVLGVGTSPWREDYAITDTPWEKRGTRMDECIDIVRGLTRPGWFEYHGELYDVPPIKMTPVPERPMPILIGGHAEAALRRAAIRGDGWMHGGGDPADLPELLDRLAALRKEAGREGDDFEVHVISFEAFTVDGVRRLEEQGVTDVVVGFRWPYDVGPDTEPLQSKLDSLRRFADEVIAKTQ